MAEIKNLKKVATRILEAIKNQEKIILYGDADLDGVTSVIILKETIKNLNGQITTIYFPDREKEGYGINEEALKYLKKFSPGLFLTLDCGIGNFEEIDLAKKMGFEVVVIDHHEILEKLPKAKIIVDPKQKGDNYPFKKFATCGIVFKLSEFLLEKKMTENLKKNLLELVAIGTIADMMPQENENKVFIEEGLRSLENSWRPGIRAFFQMPEFNHYLNLNQRVSKIISLLNIRDIEENLPASFRLLTAPSLNEAEELIRKLLEKSKGRRERIEMIIKEIEERISSQPIIFEGSPDWEVTLISAVASHLCQKYQKPTFIFKILEKESLGTVRVPSEIDSVALMKKCSEYLLTYGGHPQASGFRIKNENLEKFKKCLLQNMNLFPNLQKRE